MATPKQIKTVSYLDKDNIGNLGGKIQIVPNPGTIETINYACNAYGFLIERGEKLTCNEFADRIAMHYDCETIPQNREVVKALRACI